MGVEGPALGGLVVGGGLGLFVIGALVVYSQVPPWVTGRANLLDRLRNHSWHWLNLLRFTARTAEGPLGLKDRPAPDWPWFL